MMISMPARDNLNFIVKDLMHDAIECRHMKDIDHCKIDNVFAKY